METIELIQLLQTLFDTEEPREISGTTLAELAQELVNRELFVGGPYAILPEEENSLGDEAFRVNLELNLAVRTFLYRMGITQPSMHVPENKTLFNENNHHEYSFRPITPSFEEQKAEIQKQILTLARERFKKFPEFVSEKAIEIIHKTIERNNYSQIMLMPLYVRIALGKKGEEIDDGYISEIAFNSILFWAATIIYDDFWDEDDSANPELLPIANIFARQYADYFTSISPEFTAFFHGIMDKLDTANAWETCACRMVKDGVVLMIPAELPEYGECKNKFYPAAGIIFGPILILTKLGYTLESAEVAALINYFRHFIIGMQLNDDMHDWKEDLERGHISTVVAKLLESYKAEHPDRDKIHIENEMHELERLFWFGVLSPLATEAMTHSEKAIAALKDCVCIENPNVLEQFVFRNQHVAHEAQSEYRRSVEFIAATTINSEIS